MVGRIKADFHNHLRTSSNLQDEDFNQSIDLAHRRLGRGGAFGMINFSDTRYERFSELGGYQRIYVGPQKNAIYIPEKDILVVKGQEVPTEQGHLLVLGLGYDQHIKQHQSLEDTINEARKYGATIVADHPFFAEGIGSYLKGKGNRHLKEIDAIETYNGEATIGIFSNFRAKNFTRMSRDIGSLATSDGHSMYKLGSAWTEVDEISKNPNDFLMSLRSSVKNTKNSRQKKSYLAGFFGAIDHILDLIWIVKIAPKILLGSLYETERPEGPKGYTPPKGLN